MSRARCSFQSALRIIQLSKNNNTAQISDSPKAHNNLVYVKDMLGELRTVADVEGADMLSYLIEMAYIECGEILSNSRPLNLGLQNKGYKSS
jgi:hypothetical protein